MTSRQIGVVARGLAIVLVVAAIIDPVVTTERRTRALVSVVAVTAFDSSDAARIGVRLSDTYDVIAVPSSASAATVLVGARRVAPALTSAGPVVAVVDDSWIGISRVDVAPIAAVDATLRIGIAVAVAGSLQGKIALRLEQDGVTRERLSVTLDEGVTAIDTAFRVVPERAGLLSMRVIASTDGAARDAAWDFVTTVRDARWAVLFFDPRPSWMSTFVRRAVEQDARFVVTHRVRTSRDVSRGAGAPPSALSDLASTSLFDAIIVGAPDALSASDMDGLERLMRREGSTVIALQDSVASGAAWRRLTGVSGWRDLRGSYALHDARVGAPLSRLRATHIAVPQSLPAAVDTLAVAERESVPHLALWSRSIGAGQLVVSGALDQWRYRDAERYDFSAFWTSLIADAAASAIPTIITDAVPSLVRAGTEVSLVVTDRAALLGRTASAPQMHAVLHAPNGDADTVSLVPTHTASASGSLRARPASGTYQLHLTSGAATRIVPIDVRADIARDGVVELSALSAWAAASGGALVRRAAWRDIPPLLDKSIVAPVARTPWHPMRSPWWIVPFALLLGLDWWLRRRDALP